MTVPFNYPFNIAANTPAIADEVQSNFDDLLAWINNNYLQIDGSPSMTGPLTLPGPPNAPNQAANKSYVDAVLPVGMILEFAGSVLPPKFRWADGAIYSQTDPANQPLFAAIGIAYNKAEDNVPAGSFQVPDKRGRVGVGFQAGNATFGTLGNRGGQTDSELLQHLHSVPQHGHTAATQGGGGVDHLHTAGSLTTTVNGQHGHNLGNGAVIAYRGFTGLGFQYIGNPGNVFWWENGDATFLHDGNHQHTMTGATGAADRSLAHNHGIVVTDAAAFNSTNAGAGTTLVNKNLQPYLVCNYIVYAGA